MVIAWFSYGSVVPCACHATVMIALPSECDIARTCNGHCKHTPTRGEGIVTSPTHIHTYSHTHIEPYACIVTRVDVIVSRFVVVWTLIDV